MEDRKYNVLASPELVEEAIRSLKNNGIQAVLVNTAQEAKEKVLESIPQGSEVFTMTSVTLEACGLTEEINESGKFRSVRDQLSKETDENVKRKLGAAPDWAVGSVQAVSQDGKVLVVSNTGSQLPAYAYGGGRVIWVVGTQKIVKDFDEGLERIYDYVLPLESERAKKAYGVPGSNVSKLLVINKEINPERLMIVFVSEVLGY